MLGLVQLLLGPITWLVLAIGGLVSCYHFAIGNKKAVLYWVGGTVFLVVGLNLAIMTLGPTSGTSSSPFSMVTPVFGGNNEAAASLIGSQPTGIMASMFLAGCSLCQLILGSLFKSGAIILVGGCLIIYHFYTFTVKHDTGSPIKYVLVMVGVGVLCLVPTVTITAPSTTVAAKNLLGPDTMKVLTRSTGNVSTSTIPIFPALAFSSANALAEYISLNSFAQSKSANVAIYSAWASAEAKPESLALIQLYAAVCSAGERGELANQGKFLSAPQISANLGITPPSGSEIEYANDLNENMSKAHGTRTGFLDAKIPARTMMPLAPESDKRLYAVSPNAWTTSGSMPMMEGTTEKHKYFYTTGPSNVVEAAIGDIKTQVSFSAGLGTTTNTINEGKGLLTTIGTPLSVNIELIPKYLKNPSFTGVVAMEPVGSNRGRKTLESSANSSSYFWSCSTGRNKLGLKTVDSTSLTDSQVKIDAAGNSLLSAFLFSTARENSDSISATTVGYHLMDLGDVIRSKIAEQERIGCENVNDAMSKQAWSCAVFAGGQTNINAENTVWTNALYRIGNNADTSNFAAALATTVPITVNSGDGIFAADLIIQNASRFSPLASTGSINDSPDTASTTNSAFSSVSEVRDLTNKGIGQDLETDGGKFRSQFYVWMSGRHIIESLYNSTNAPSGTSNKSQDLADNSGFLIGLKSFVTWIFTQVLVLFSLLAMAMASLTKAVAPGLMGFCYFVMLLLYPAFALVALLPNRHKVVLDYAKGALWISLWPIGYILGIKMMDPVFGQAIISGATAGGDVNPSGMLNFCAAGIILMTPTLLAAMMSPSFQGISSAINGIYGLGMKLVGGAVAVTAGAAVAAVAAPSRPGLVPSPAELLSKLVRPEPMGQGRPLARSERPGALLLVRCEPPTTSGARASTPPRRCRLWWVPTIWAMACAPAMPPKPQRKMSLSSRVPRPSLRVALVGWPNALA